MAGGDRAPNGALAPVDWGLAARCAFGPPRPQQGCRGEPYHEWRSPQGTLWTAFYRTGSGYLVRFPGLADFLVSADGYAASCSPVPGVGDAVQQHLYLNQVRPLMLSRQGCLAFHASAVAVPEGAVAFAAPSGRGKSTLAAAFATAGHRFLTDDGLHLEREGAGFAVLPSHPSIRLWNDSRNALVSESAPVAPALPSTLKARILAADRMPFCDQPRELRAAYFLGDGRARDVEVARMSGAHAIREWISHAFILDPDDRPGLGRHFEGVARLSSTVPCYSLDYPRRYDGLADLRDFILDHVAAARPWP